MKNPITHHRYCKEEIVITVYSTFSICENTMYPVRKYVRMYEDYEYTFTEKFDKFSEREVSLYYTHMNEEYTIKRYDVEKFFHTVKEGRKIKIGKILKD